MGFTKYIYNEVMEIKRKQLQSGDAKRIVLKEQLYSDIPRVKEIDAELSKLGLGIVHSTMSGKADEIDRFKMIIEKLTAERDSLFDSKKYTAPFFCPKCEDKGIINGNYCECVNALAKQLEFKELSSTAPFAECTFDNFSLDYYPESSDSKIPPRLRMEKNLTYLKKYAAHFPTQENLLLIGGAGLGKTHISIAIGNEVLNSGHSVFYASIEDLINKLERERFNRNNEQFSYYEAVENTDLLIIDDLGTEFLTQFGKSAIYDIINGRLLSKKATIINTNLFIEEIATRYSERISSRFIGNYTSILFDGKDIRQQKAMKK